MWKLQEDILEQKDKDCLAEYITQTDRFTQFTQVKAFEKAWSQWQGCTHSVFVNSGSSADLVMMDAVKELYGIPDGSEVLVPALTWTTNITSVIQTRLKPVFVDVDLRSLSFDCDALEKAITPKTRIILVTHLIGFPAETQRIAEIAQRHGLLVLEDCCEAHGAISQGKKVGNHGTASTFSFYWGHHMTTIEGGMICTDNEELRDLFLLKRSHGLARELDASKHAAYKTKYAQIDFNFLFLTHGYNVRNTELHATIGLEQLTRLDWYVQVRNENYAKFLAVVAPYVDKMHRNDGPGISSFCLPFIFRNREDAIRTKSRFVAEGIETRPVIGGNLLRQPCFSAYGDPSAFPNAELVHQNGFYIGNNQFVDERRLQGLAKILNELFCC